MTFWVAGAVIVGGVASAAIGASGAQSAAATQAAGQEQAANTQAQMFNTITGQEQPFLQSGMGASSALNFLLGTSNGVQTLVPGVTPGSYGTNGFTGEAASAALGGLPQGYLTQQFNPTLSQLTNYPGFQFSRDIGNAATQNANAPGLGALSGAAQEGLSQFNQGLAQTYYGNYFNQFQTQQSNIFNRLSQIAGLGQNAAGNLGNAGTQLGTGIAQAQAGAAGSLAAGTVGATNAITGAIGNSLPLSVLLANQTPNYSGPGAAASAYGSAADAYAGSLPVASITGG